MLQKLHHVAYRCTDAQETIDYYTKNLGLKLVHAISNDRVPSTQEWGPHLHIFFEMEDGSYIAFFEVPTSPPAMKDPNTPDWVQHLALEVADEETLLAAKARLEENGVDVLGITDHGFCQSIYFFDPSGHRLELSIRRDSEEAKADYAARAGSIVDTWAERKRSGELQAAPAV